MQPRRFVSFLSKTENSKHSKFWSSYTLKDSITLGFSVVALSLSLFSAYNQYIKFEVGLSIGWSNWEDGPTKEISRNGVNGYSVTNDITATFMNTGNVPLLIYALEAIGRQDAKGCAGVFNPPRSPGGGYAF